MPTPQSFDPSEEQADALERIEQWFASPWAGGHSREPGVFRLAGYAGVGKTTLIRTAVERLGLESASVPEINDAGWDSLAESDFAPDTTIADEITAAAPDAPFACYGTFTGKAAHVLRSKGIDDATTLHRMIYIPKEKSRRRLRELTERRDELSRQIESPGSSSALAPDLRAALASIEREIGTERERLRSPSFELNTDSAVRHASLLVIDEVSMVDERMAADLLSFGVPILALGDPAQLPPVGGGGYLTETTPDAMLTHVHRHALESPVGRLAMSARTSRDRSRGITGMDGGSGRTPMLTIADMVAADITLCWRNTVRHGLNAAIRAALGRPAGIPVTGDRIIVMRNNHALDVFNGQTFTVLAAWPLENHPFEPGAWQLALEDDEGQLRLLDCVGWGFEGKDREREMLDLHHGRTREVALVSFANALTVHRAQGSEWPRVCVIDETPGLAGMKRKQGGSEADAALEAARWMYTAVSRASESVLVASNWR